MRIRHGRKPNLFHSATWSIANSGFDVVRLKNPDSMLHCCIRMRRLLAPVLRGRQKAGDSMYSDFGVVVESPLPSKLSSASARQAGACPLVLGRKIPTVPFGLARSGRHAWCLTALEFTRTIVAAPSRRLCPTVPSRGSLISGEAALGCGSPPAPYASLLVVIDRRIELLPESRECVSRVSDLERHSIPLSSGDTCRCGSLRC
jgi:hypothetical protein